MFLFPIFFSDLMMSASTFFVLTDFVLGIEVDLRVQLSQTGTSFRVREIDR